MVGVGSTEEEVSASFVTPPRFLVQSVLVVRGMEGFDPFSKVMNGLFSNDLVTLYREIDFFFFLFFFYFLGKWAPGDFPERQVHLRKMKVRVVDKDGAKLALKQRHRKGTANLNDGELGDGPLVVQDEMGVDGIAGSPPPAYRVPAVALGGNGGGGGADGTASVVVGSLESQGAVMTRPSTGVTKVGGMDSRRGSLGRKGKYVDVGVQTDREREGEGELPPLPVETSLSPPTVTVESDAGKSEGALVGRSNKNVSASFVGRLFQKVLCSGAQTNYLT